MKKIILAAIVAATCAFVAHSGQTTAATQPWVRQQINLALTNFVTSAELADAIQKQIVVKTSDMNSGTVSSATNLVVYLESAQNCEPYTNGTYYAEDHSKTNTLRHYYRNVTVTPQIQIWWEGPDFFATNTVFGALVPSTGETFHQQNTPNNDTYMISDNDPDRWFIITGIRVYDYLVKKANGEEL